ncbi:MAG TPA: hypothetical protein VF086_10280 [Propionibacteriaceae bacterium]
MEARDNHSLGSEQTKEGRALIGRRELIDGVIAPCAAMYQNPIVRTRSVLPAMVAHVVLNLLDVVVIMAFVIRPG